MKTVITEQLNQGKSNAGAAGETVKSAILGAWQQPIQAALD
jgi:hypothetical protein